MMPVSLYLPLLPKTVMNTGTTGQKPNQVLPHLRITAGTIWLLFFRPKKTPLNRRLTGFTIPTKGTDSPSALKSGGKLKSYH